MLRKSLLKQINKPRFFEIWFFVFGLLLPTQLGKHFWPDFAFLSGVRIDYLAPTFFLTDLIVLAGLPLFWRRLRFVLGFDWKIGLFFLVLGINLALSASKLLWLYRLYQYLRIGLIAYYFSQAKPKEIITFLQGLTYAALYSLILAFGQTLRQGSLEGWWYYLGERKFTVSTPGISTITLNGQRLLRIYATFSHPNSLAGFFLVAAALFRAFQKKPGFIFSFILVFLSLSRFSLFALAGLLLFWSYSRQGFCRVCLAVKVMLALWLVAFALLFQSSPQSLSLRLVSNLEHLKFFSTHLLGIGLGHYLSPQLTPRYQPVHNLYLLLSVELGLFIWPFLLFWGRSIYVRLKHSSALIWPLLIILAGGLFDHYSLTLSQNMNLLGVVLGLIFASSPSRRIRS